MLNIIGIKIKPKGTKTHKTSLPHCFLVTNHNLEEQRIHEHRSPYHDVLHLTILQKIIDFFVQNTSTYEHLRVSLSRKIFNDFSRMPKKSRAITIYW